MTVTNTGKPKVCVISDDLSGPPDEGVKKFTWEISRALAEMTEIRVIATKGPVQLPGVRLVPTSKTFLTYRLRRELAAFGPDLILYAARGSATFFSILRARLLQTYSPRARVAMLALQTRYHRPWQRPVLRLLAPGPLCAQSQPNKIYLEGLGLDCMLLPSGIDTRTFAPLPEPARSELRGIYGLDASRPVVLHVGHLVRGRRVEVLGDLARRGLQAVLVVSSSMAQDDELGRELEAAGVKLIRDYVPRVESLYQMADCYLFPVESTDNAIEVPLSVLEAMSCDLPVATTKFGGLVELFGEGPHQALRFCSSREELLQATIQLAAERPGGNRALVGRYSWSRIAEMLLERCLHRGAEAGVQNRSGQALQEVREA